jgi:hypothetical protein
MESVELKVREIDNVQFPVVLTKKMVEIPGEPEMSIEVKTGQITEPPEARSRFAFRHHYS